MRTIYLTTLGTVEQATKRFTKLKKKLIDENQTQTSNQTEAYPKQAKTNQTQEQHLNKETNQATNTKLNRRKVIYLHAIKCEELKENRVEQEEPRRYITNNHPSETFGSDISRIRATAECRQHHDNIKSTTTFKSSPFREAMDIYNLREIHQINKNPEKIEQEK